MPYDNGLFALMNPGAAREYFTLPHRPDFEPDRKDYSPANAWWLAELSRLVYCEHPAVRSTALTKVGLRTIDFFHPGSTEGLVAEARDSSFAVLVFRGTSDIMDWATNIKASPAKWPGGGQVHEGFQQALHSVWSEIEKGLPKDTPLFYSGHSLGAALATLAASRRPPRALYNFGSPLVGDSHFVATLKDVPFFRVVNNRDIVTTAPPPSSLFELVHGGELHYIAHDNTMLVSPDDETVEADRKKIDDALAGTVDPGLFDLPQPFSDHAPINYVTHLEEYLD